MEEITIKIACYISISLQKLMVWEYFWAEYGLEELYKFLALSPETLGKV